MSVIVEIADAVAASINDGTYAEPVTSGWMRATTPGAMRCSISLSRSATTCGTSVSLATRRPRG